MAVMIRAWAALALVGWAAAVGLVAVELMVKMSASVAGCRVMGVLVVAVVVGQRGMGAIKVE
jgi:hypothetical protein